MKLVKMNDANLVAMSIFQRNVINLNERQEMKILKVKWLNDRMAISYEKDEAHHSFEIPERPAPSFFTALDGLLEYWVNALELTKGGKVEVYGATFSYHKDSSDITAIIHGKQHLQKSDFSYAINAPKMVQTSEDGDNPISKECLKAVKALIKASKEYVEGKREQIKLDLAKTA